jgi:NO-binding membrane sensor protein with MHYT domain
MIFQYSPLIGSYDDRLVAFSIVIALLGSYAALELAGRVTTERGPLRALWLNGGALALGTGIRSLHSIGMLGFRMLMAIARDG